MILKASNITTQIHKLTKHQGNDAPHQRVTSVSAPRSVNGVAGELSTCDPYGEAVQPVRCCLAASRRQSLAVPLVGLRAARYLSPRQQALAAHDPRWSGDARPFNGVTSWAADRCAGIAASTSNARLGLRPVAAQRLHRMRTGLCQEQERSRETVTRPISAARASAWMLDILVS